MKEDKKKGLFVPLVSSCATQHRLSLRPNVSQKCPKLTAPLQFEVPSAAPLQPCCSHHIPVLSHSPLAEAALASGRALPGARI